MIKLSPSETNPKYIGRMTRMGMTTFMVLTHVSTAVFAMMAVEAIKDWSWPAQLVAIVLGGGAFGWLITRLALDDLEQVETALARLAQGLTVPPLPTRQREPMRFMMEHVNALIERERELAQMRRQLGQQVGEAAAQEERSRLARDLHDSIKQQIFSMSVSAAAAQVRWESDPPGARAALDDVRKSAQEAMVEMRAMLQQLAPAPLEKVGLTEALRDQCEALGFRSGARVTCEIGTLPSDDRLPPGAQEALFRIAQEALTNIARHARAQTAFLTLETTEAGIRMTIRDDGQGFDPAAAASGMGRANMQARAGAVGGVLHLASAPGAGTQLQVDIPYVRLPVIEDQPETEWTPALEKQIGEAKLWLQGSAVVAFIALVFGFVTLLGIGRADTPLWLAVVVVIFGVVGLAGLVGGIWGTLRGLRTMRAVQSQLGSDSAASYLLRYNALTGLILLPLFGFIFLPAALVETYGGSAAVTVGALSLAGCVAVAVFVFRIYDRYLIKLSFAQLKKAAYEGFIESGWNRWSWIWSLPMLLNLLFDFPPQFPPLDTGDWIDMSLPAAGTLFLIWGIAYTWYHRRLRRKIAAWRQHHEQNPRRPGR